MCNFESRFVLVSDSTAKLPLANVFSPVARRELASWRKGRWMKLIALHDHVTQNVRRN